MSDNPILVTSRSFQEYLAFFDLTPDRLPSSIVDVSAGASSFVAEASRRGVRALAVDPAYQNPGAVRDCAREGLDGGNQIIAEHSDRFVYDWYGSPTGRNCMRRRALETFVADYRDHPQRYLAAALPGLPLASASFELALCSHLLFTWAENLDELWHLAAVIELARVAEEVRVFPLVLQGDGRPVNFLDALRTRLSERFGITSSVEPVPYEFQHGAFHMLRLGVARK